MAKDKDYIKLIHTARWLKLRRSILSAHPLCERCEAQGYITPATEVHHRRPVEHGLTYADKHRLMYDADNLCALCHDCHVRIHTEMGRSGKAATLRRNAEQVSAAIRKLFGD